MRTIDMQQGSDEWLAMRHAHNNSSESAAMLGLDPNKKRTDLLKIRKFGTQKEFTEWVQKNILEKGHAVEASARAILESEINEDLYPVSTSDDDGWLYASVDGITMDGDTIFEHKQWNTELANYIRANGTIPDSHMPQVQQSLMVTGANKCIFVVSDGTKNNRIIIEIEPDHEWADRIVSGWKQFEKDLDEFVPENSPEIVIPVIVSDLPALSIRTSGEISIQSNLDLFGEKLKGFVSALNLKPDDDQGFADAEAAIKVLIKAEESLDAGEKYAISQMSSVEQMRLTISNFSNIARDARLSLQKVVKNRKNELKQNAIQGARMEFIQHVRDMEKEISPYRLNIREPDFVLATKNLRTLESFRDAVSTTLANGKIECDRLAKEAREKLSVYKTISDGFEFLFADLQDILSKPLDDFKNAILFRIDAHKKTMEQKAREKEKQFVQTYTSGFTGVFPENPVIADDIIPPKPEKMMESEELTSTDIDIQLTSMRDLCEDISRGFVPEYAVSLNPVELRRWIISSGVRSISGLKIKEVN